MKKIAVMVVLRAGDQYLLLRRAKMPNAGKYAPVGGKLEAHERPLEAALRETLEETGIVIREPLCCGVLTETSPVDYNWICYIYLADIAWQEPPFCDEGQLEWVHADRIGELPVPPTDPAVYDYIRRGEKFIMDAAFDADLNLLHLVDELSGRDLSHLIPRR